MTPMKSILVVDDHPTNRMVIASVIARSGYRALQASDGEEALAIVRSERPELVISDILMPVIDGFEFVRQLRADPEVAATKVIFCTATYHEHEAGELARTAGVFRVLAKPCKPADLVQAIEQAIARDAAAPAAIGATFDRAHVQLMTDKLSQHETALVRAQRVARLGHVISAPDGSFVSWSETLRELTGLADEDLPRSTRAWLGIIHPDYRERFRACSLRAARTGERTEVEYLLGRADGSWINIYQVIEPIGAEPRPGAGTRWFSTIQDVTVQVQAQEEVRRLNADLERRVADRTVELEAAMKELESFDYSISHDLRTPINRILGFTEALAADHAARLDADGQELLERITRAAQRMDQLVRDLFSLSTVSRGELRRSQVDVTALAKTIASGLQSANPSRSVDVRVAEGLVAWADPGLLRIVLDNLLGNAWKFTSKREDARIEVGTARGDPGTSWFVRDNGAGFDPALAEKLFAPFQRLHSSKDFEGTGIGLATVSRIVARHGGRVWGEGKVGEGATIRFTLSR